MVNNEISRGFFLVVFLFIIIFGYSIYGNKPLVAQPWQWADDGLYWQQAIQIKKWLAGESSLWLGEYTKTILSKAPFFAIFLVGVNISGIPLPVVQFLLLILLAFYFLKALEPAFQSNGFFKALILFIFICYPYLPCQLNLIRNVLSSTLMGYLLVSLIGLIFRADCSAWKQAVWGGLSGFFLALCYLCREEGAWLAAPALLTVGVLFIFAWQKSRLLQSTAAPVSLLLTFFAPVLLVCALNYQSYGAFITTDRRAPQFVKAFKLLASLEPENARRFVPMPEATRRKVYQHSPTFARLQPHLEGKVTDSLATNPGHLALNEAQPGEREFFVSNYEFALRRAVWETSIRTFQGQEEFWRSVIEQVESAVVRGQLTQGNKPLALCASMQDGDTLKIMNSALKSFASLFLLKGVSIPFDPRSSGNESDVASMGALTNSQLAPMKSSNFQLPNNTRIRSDWFFILNKLVQFCYLVGFAAPFFLIFRIFKDLFSGKIDLVVVQLFASSILCLGTLALFCIMMGVLNICGWPHLKYHGSYNNLGLIILSLTACIGCAATVFLFQKKICYKKIS